MLQDDKYYGKTQSRVRRTKDMKGTEVLNKVVRGGLTEGVTLGKRRGKCREKNVH